LTLQSIRLDIKKITLIKENTFQMYMDPWIKLRTAIYSILSLLYLIPGVFFTMKNFVVFKPHKDYWSFIDKVYYLAPSDKLFYMILSYLLALLHFYVLIFLQKMDSIGLNVMLE
jgi:hypothetical protein